MTTTTIRAALHFAARQPMRSGGDDLEFGDPGIAKTFDLSQPRDRRRHNFAERAEFFDQRFCQRLHVTLRASAGS